MNAAELTASDIVAALRDTRFGTVARLRDAYLKAVRQRSSHPGDVTEQGIAQAATALRDAYVAEQKDIAKAERARALDYATIALNRPRRRA